MSTISERLIGVIVDKLEVDTEKVVLTANFVNDLGADSLDLTELVMAFEEEFEIEISDDDAEKITTVQSALDYINKHV